MSMIWTEAPELKKIKARRPMWCLMQEIEYQISDIDTLLDDLATDYDTQMAYEGSAEELMEARIYLGRLKEQVRRYGVALGEEWD